MDWRGHVGLNLAVLSLVGMLFNFYDVKYSIIVAVSTLFSSLPDIDLRLEVSHRKYTHNVLFALVFSILFGCGTYYLVHDFNLGFSIMFSALIIHIVGDLMTYKPFNPFAPFTKEKYSFRLFRSSSKVVNNALMMIGSVLYGMYLAGLIYMKITH